MIPTVGTKISGYFFSLIFPFVTPLTIAENLSFIKLIIGLIPIFLEAYITHRLLKKPCTFVVPRMFAINFVAMLAEVLVFVGLVGIFWILAILLNIEILSKITDKEFVTQEIFLNVIAYPLALFGFIGAIILFYVRWKVFCKMFAWFDKSVSQAALRKTMLYAVGASYFFWIVVMAVERLFKLNL